MSKHQYALPEAPDQDLLLPPDPVARAQHLLDALGDLPLYQCCAKAGGCGGVMVWSTDEEEPILTLHPKHPKARQLGNLIDAAPELIRELLQLVKQLRAN